MTPCNQVILCKKKKDQPRKISICYKVRLYISLVLDGVGLVTKSGCS
jgi:hypothetical protein